MTNTIERKKICVKNARKAQVEYLGMKNENIHGRY